MRVYVRLVMRIVPISLSFVVHSFFWGGVVFLEPPVAKKNVSQVVLVRFRA